MLAGRGALEFGDAVIDLRAGDAATFQGTIPHRLRNTGRRGLRALSIITPAIVLTPTTLPEIPGAGMGCGGRPRAGTFADGRRRGGKVYVGPLLIKGDTR
jgi:Cupin domain